MKNFRGFKRIAVLIPSVVPFLLFPLTFLPPFLSLILLPVFAAPEHKTEPTTAFTKADPAHKGESEPTSRAYLDQVHTQIKAHHYDEAMKMLKVKAAKGCKYSQSLLGLMYQKGLGCKADAKEAAHWFGLAAKNDFADAQFQLGKLYGNASRELAPEANQAKYWLSKAAANGVSEAKQLMDKVPGGAEMEYKVAQLRNSAQVNASESEQGLEQSWAGYANIVKTLNGSATNNSGNN